MLPEIPPPENRHVARISAGVTVKAWCYGQNYAKGTFKVTDFRQVGATIVVPPGPLGCRAARAGEFADGNNSEKVAVLQ